MNKRKRILLLAVLALIICGLGLVLYLSHEPPEPTYEGEPLSYWLTAYAPGGYQLENSKGPPPPTWQKSDQAIMAMGANAFPYLLRMLQARDSELKSGVMSLLLKQHLIYISFERADSKNHKALAAFRTLGHSASNAVPQLTDIFNKDPNPFPQQAVPIVFGLIGPAARPAIPALLRGVTHTNWTVRYQSAMAIYEIRPDPKLVVPALIELLDDSDLFVRRAAVRTLGSFGSDARAAVPALVKLAANEKYRTREEMGARGFFFEQVIVTGTWKPSSSNLSNEPTFAMDALRTIDPDTAAEAAKK